ncbi:Na+:solute symporter [Rhodocaloribacter litoris]|uniref:sodium:solute symporter family protein n=1 Tax=Rhodocaloribacter litoris TaxID=2558931 RepID=UPI00141F0567|nr:sodium:solute symporter family protein [Rhodocaloribacter litoris]QXD15991.1 Na+:solute symporter [Rhodocaloribacter litoris]
MRLLPLDWVVIALYGGITVALGLWFTRRAGQSIEDYFVAGRTLPWWLAGTSIAATWFASDAPLAAASLVRQQGIYGNWLWWYEAAGVMLLVFFFARLWRRAEVITDAEFIELRYDGPSASVLRAFTAVYQGILRNCVVMGWVMLAMVKFSQVLLGWGPVLTLGVCVALALLYTVASGLWGVVMTDLLQFVTGITGSLILAGIVVYELGGPAEMARQIAALPEAPAGTLDLVPNPAHLSPLEFVSYLCLILVLWTRSGHDGYIAQRLFATRDDRQATLTALWFCFAGTLMTWPWIVAGLGSLVVFPPGGPEAALAADPELAYPMMIAEMMPTGLRGLLVAAFLAAFMSTMDTHLCWGASYLVTDVYKRFLRREASSRHYVLASRLAVLVLVLLAALAAWQMESIERAWIYIIELTAGMAMVLLLRWYWWRVNAWAEISAMVGSVLIANGLLLARGLDALGLMPAPLLDVLVLFYGAEYNFIRSVVILLVCTLIWVTVTLHTRPVSEEKLVAFYRRVRPGGWWGPVAARCPDVPADTGAGAKWLGWFLGVLFIYAGLLGVGQLVLGHTAAGLLLVGLSLACALGTLRLANSG